MREHTQAIIIYFYFREEKNSCFTGFSDFQCHEIRALRIHMISLIPDGHFDKLFNGVFNHRNVIEPTQ